MKLTVSSFCKSDLHLLQLTFIEEIGILPIFLIWNRKYSTSEELYFNFAQFSRRNLFNTPSLVIFDFVRVWNFLTNAVTNNALNFPDHITQKATKIWNQIIWVNQISLHWQATYVAYFWNSYAMNVNHVNLQNSHGHDFRKTIWNPRPIGWTRHKTITKTLSLPEFLIQQVCTWELMEWLRRGMNIKLGCNKLFNALLFARLAGLKMQWNVVQKLLNPLISLYNLLNQMRRVT